MPDGRIRLRSGRRIYVEDGRPEGTGGLTIVAIHGLGGGAWFFTGLARRLAPEHRVLALDLPGTGRSGRLKPLSIAAWLDDLDDLIATHVEGPAVLLGHSMGTIVALEAWSRRPDLVRAMLFVGGLPVPRDEVKQRLALRAVAVERDGLEGIGPEASAANFAAATRRDQPELVALYERVFEAQDAGVYAAWCRLLIASSAAAIVPAVGAPCAAITGAEDQYAPPELVGAFLRELPGAAGVTVLPDCAHLPFLERPDDFAAAVRAFAATLC